MCCYNPCCSLMWKQECDHVCICHRSIRTAHTLAPGQSQLQLSIMCKDFLLGPNKRIRFAYFSLFIASQLFFWSAFCVQHVQHHLEREKLFTLREENVCMFWAHWSKWLDAKKVHKLQCCLRWKQVELQKVQAKKAGVTFWEPCVMLHYQTRI